MAAYGVCRTASPFAAVCMVGLRKRNGKVILPHPFGAADRGLPALPAYGCTISETAPEWLGEGERDEMKGEKTAARTGTARGMRVMQNGG